MKLNVSRQVLILAIARAIQAFSVSFIIVILPIYISGDQISNISTLGNIFFGLEITVELLIGIAISSTALISSLGQPIGGSVSDAFNRRKIFAVSGLGLLTATIPFYLVTNTYGGVLVLRIIQGIAGAMLVPSIAAIINSESDGDSRGESFGIYNTLRLVGFGFGPIVAGAVISLGPYNVFSYVISGVDAAFWVTMIGSGIGFLIVLLFVKEPNRVKTNDEQYSSIFEVLRSDKFRLIFILGLTNFLLAASIAVFITLEGPVSERLNQSSFMFSLQFSAAILANTISQTPVGRISDNYGRKPLILLGFLILIPSITVQGFVIGSYQMLFARIVQGVSVALVFAPSLALAGDMAEDRNPGLYLSVLTGGFQLGIAAGPTVSGLLFSIGGFSTPFVFSGLAATMGLILVQLYIPNKNKILS